MHLILFGIIGLKDSYRILVQKLYFSDRNKIKSAIITEDWKKFWVSFWENRLFFRKDAPVAQWIEHQPSKLLVVGSTPTGGAL
jgi:hypothetical protein